MRTNKKLTLHSLLFPTFFLPALITLGQDTTFIDQDWNKVESIQHATYFATVVYHPADTNRATKTVYFRSGQIKTQNDYAVYKDRKLDGKSKEWFESGQLRKDIDYKDGKKSGQLITYWANGKLKRTDTYDNDTLTQGKCMTPEGRDTIHYDFEKMPEFPGGFNALIQYLRKELRYPKAAQRAGVEGLVLIGFVVNTNGTISNVKVVKSAFFPELDQEALRMVRKMPNWEPGMEDGEVAKVAFHLPIHFQLQ